MIELRSIPHSERPEIARRFADYLAELGVSPGGPDPYFDRYWREDNRWADWICARGDFIGFAFCWQDGNTMELAEFCIFEDWRRSGYGRAAASAVFAGHPGKWRLGVLDANTEGLAFWRAILPVGAELRDNPCEFEFQATSEGRLI